MPFLTPNQQCHSTAGNIKKHTFRVTSKSLTYLTYLKLLEKNVLCMTTTSVPSKTLVRSAGYTGNKTLCSPEPNTVNVFHLSARLGKITTTIIKPITVVSNMKFTNLTEINNWLIVNSERFVGRKILLINRTNLRCSYSLQPVSVQLPHQSSAAVPAAEHVHWKHHCLALLL